MATVAGRAGRTVHVVGRVERRPPICAGDGNVVRPPSLVLDVPLSRKRIVVVAHFGEIPLFPFAAINEGDLLPRKFGNRVGVEIRNDRVGVLSRVADDIRHRRLLPTFVDVGMALLAGLRARVVRRRQSAVRDKLLTRRKRLKLRT